MRYYSHALDIPHQKNHLLIRKSASEPGHVFEKHTPFPNWLCSPRPFLRNPITKTCLSTVGSF